MKRGHLILVIGVLTVQITAAGIALAQDELSNLPDPTRPSMSTSLDRGHAEKTDKIANLNLESTIVSGYRRIAIINGEILGVGDHILGARITLITPYSVMLDHKGQLVTLKLVKDKLTRPRRMQEAAR